MGTERDRFVFVFVSSAFFFRFHRFSSRPQAGARRGGVLKQGSFNDGLLSRERLAECEKLKRSFPRQRSLGDEKILAGRRSSVAFLR